jgi:hypothetical protein
MAVLRAVARFTWIGFRCPKDSDTSTQGEYMEKIWGLKAMTIKEDDGDTLTRMKAQWPHG